jgi:hypothetical protein
MTSQKQGCTPKCLAVSKSLSEAKRAVSSVVEHYLDTVGVTGSNPVSRMTRSEIRHLQTLKKANLTAIPMTRR